MHSTNNKKSILILGDSLTFGRSNHQVLYHDTWPALIESIGYKVMHRGIGGAHSGKVLNEVNQLNDYWCASNNTPIFDACIIQVGIVDCTPRILPINLSRAIALLPGGQHLIKKGSKNKLLLKLIGKPWVNLDQFKKNVMLISTTANKLASKVFFIAINKPAHYLIDNVGDFSSTVDEYNSAIEIISNNGFLSIFNDDSRMMHLLPDGHHLTKTGHKRTADAVLKLV